MLQCAIHKYSNRDNGCFTFNSSFTSHLLKLSHSRLEQPDSISLRSISDASNKSRSSFLKFGKPLNGEGGLKDTQLSWICRIRDMLALLKSSMGNVYLSLVSTNLLSQMLTATNSPGAKSSARFLISDDTEKLIQLFRCVVDRFFGHKFQRRNKKAASTSG